MTEHQLTAEDVRNMFDRFAENLILRLDRREQHFVATIRQDQERSLTEYAVWCAKLEDAGKWIGELRKRTHDHGNNIQAINGAIEEMQEQINGLQAQVTELKREMAELTVTVHSEHPAALTPAPHD